MVGDALLAQEAATVLGDEDVVLNADTAEVLIGLQLVEVQELGVKHLVLYHTEDTHLITRAATYTAEAAQYYKGPILVPADLESFTLTDN